MWVRASAGSCANWESTNIVVERLGKYHHFGRPGFNWLIPIIDTMHLVNVIGDMAGVLPLTGIPV
jgi:hypothetical protein